MELTNYILELLENENEITLPTFGKFNLVFHSAFLISDKEELLPPDYLVSFTQQHDLNNTDIFKRISTLESVDEKTIKEKYFVTISEWKNNLKTNTYFNLQGLGVLTLDKEKILFTMDNNCIFSFKNFGLPSIKNTLAYQKEL